MCDYGVRLCDCQGPKQVSADSLCDLAITSKSLSTSAKFSILEILWIGEYLTILRP
jgi:hypothetical protein